MRLTLGVAIYLLGIAAAAFTTVPQFRYGQWLDPDAFFAIGDIAVPYGTATLMVSLHWAKLSSLLRLYRYGGGGIEGQRLSSAPSALVLQHCRHGMRSLSSS